MKRDGMLATPDDTARQLVDYVPGNTFGEAPTADVRALPGAPVR